MYFAQVSTQKNARIFFPARTSSWQILFFAAHIIGATVNKWIVGFGCKKVIFAENSLIVLQNFRYLLDYDECPTARESEEHE